jgi:molybdopterin-guanine dinucleotide biosynthesis protein A
MRWATSLGGGISHVATASADAPFLPADLVVCLARALAGRPSAVALAQSAGELHPVIGLWPVGLADDLEQALRSGTRKVLDWTDRHGTVPVNFALRHVAGRDIDPFFNANTPAELDEARRLLALLPP